MVNIFKTNKKYKIIYADPPWHYRVWGRKGNKKCAEAHYDTMSLEDIKRLPVSRICEKDSVLFLWVTFPLLEESFEVIKAWGFEYTTVAFVWVKTNKKSDSLFWGLGYYTRANVELCLLSTKGKKLPRKSHSVHQIVFSKVREHSRKPDEIREKIIDLFGDLSRIELFARQEVMGWNSWGNQTSLFNKEKEGVVKNE